MFLGSNISKIKEQMLLYQKFYTVKCNIIDHVLYEG